MQINVQTMNDKARMSLQGRFDFNAHREFRLSYESLLAPAEVKEIEVDLGGVEYLDSSALGMLLMLREKAGASQKELALSNCHGTVRQVLDIANFDKLFSIR